MSKEESVGNDKHAKTDIDYLHPDGKPKRKALNESEMKNEQDARQDADLVKKLAVEKDQS